MSLKIISEKDNPLLGRKELMGEIEFKGPTPSADDVKKMVASKAGGDEKLTVVKIIDNNYGEQKAGITAYVYRSLDEFKKLEKLQEEKPKEEAEGEAEGGEKKGEAPAETKPEEKKEESKPEEKKEEPKPAETKSEEKKEEAKPVEAKPGEKKGE